MSIEEILRHALRMIKSGEARYICHAIARVECMALVQAADTEGYRFLNLYLGMSEDSDQWIDSRADATGRAYRELVYGVHPHALDLAQRITMLTAGINLARRLGR